MKTFLHASWLLLMVLAAGCAVAPPDRGGTPGDASGKTPEVEPGKEGERAAPAVVALLGQADAASAGGDHQRAAALLERALRIEPSNAALWHNLAVVRYREADYGQAESMAMRSNRHAGDQRDLIIRNWQLIAVSRELSGNTSGATEARARIDALRTGNAR